MSQVQIIAEIGMTHDGSLGQAKAFINAAADCGVDAVKFQTHIAEAETLKNAPAPYYFKDESRFDYFKRTAFSLEQHKILKDFAEKERGVEFISSPFSLEAIDLLEEVGVKTYKIPSGEVTNTPYLMKVGKTGKRVLLSSGMSSWDELDEAVSVLCESGCKDLVVMQCTSEYPCPPEETGLNIMLEMKQRYQTSIGFSDHTIGVGVPVAAVVLGADVVEKHFTLSKLMYGPDAKNSADYEDFCLLVNAIRCAESSVKNTLDKDTKVQGLKQMKITFEKSIVAATDIPTGTVLTESHLNYKKPGDGISARKFRDILGRMTTHDIIKDQQIQYGSIV
jgi:N,N'-diacetyllegionaminate synthase